VNCFVDNQTQGEDKQGEDKQGEDKQGEDNQDVPANLVAPMNVCLELSR